MLEMMIVATSTIDGLVDLLRQLIMPIILIVVGVMAIVSAIRGNIIQLLTLIGVFVVALVIFLNPSIVSGLGTAVGEEVCTTITCE
jgi:hypothetical protein